MRSRGDDIAHYLVSLPERTLRSLTALAGGLVLETSEFVLPPFLRRSRLYKNLVDTTLRFLIEKVGQVEGAYPSEGEITDDFLLRRGVGNGIELVGILTFRASPVWVLAALADLAGAGRQLIPPIAEALVQDGLLEPGSRFESMEQLLDGLERTAGRTADTINMPPLNVEQLRADWRDIQAEARKVPLPEVPRIRAAWVELENEAQAQGRSTFELSTALALAAVRGLPEGVGRLGKSAAVIARTSGQIFASQFLDHYSSTLGEIRRQGYLSYLRQEFRPYLRAALRSFQPKRKSLTERWLGG